MGGGWLGVLAVDEPTASKLAADLPPSVWEITEEEFSGVKKKAPETLTDWRRSPPKPQNKEALVVVAPAEPRIEATKPDVIAADATVNGVVLSTTRATPPPEPLLEAPSEKRRKAA